MSGDLGSRLGSIFHIVMPDLQSEHISQPSSTDGVCISKRHHPNISVYSESTSGSGHMIRNKCFIKLSVDETSLIIGRKASAGWELCRVLCRAFDLMLLSGCSSVDATNNMTF